MKPPRAGPGHARTGRAAGAGPPPEPQAPGPERCSAPLRRGGQAAGRPRRRGARVAGRPRREGACPADVRAGDWQRPGLYRRRGGRRAALPGALRFSSRAGERAPAGVSHGGRGAAPPPRPTWRLAGREGGGSGAARPRFLPFGTDASAPPGNSGPTSRRPGRAKSGGEGGWESGPAARPRPPVPTRQCRPAAAVGLAPGCGAVPGPGRWGRWAPRMRGEGAARTGVPLAGRRGVAAAVRAAPRRLRWSEGLRLVGAKTVRRRAGVRPAPDQPAECRRRAAFSRVAGAERLRCSRD